MKFSNYWYFSSSGSGIGTCAAPLPCPLASGIIISPGTTADTFLHVLCDKEIRFFGRKNRVWGGDLSLSGYRFERLEVPNSQCSAAKQTIWDCKIDLLTRQDWISWRRFARVLTTGRQYGKFQFRIIHWKSRLYKKDKELSENRLKIASGKARRILRQYFCVKIVSYKALFWHRMILF